MPRRPPCRHSLPRALVKAFGLPFLVAGCYKFVNDILVFAGPVLLNRIIAFVQVCVPLPPPTPQPLLLLLLPSSNNLPHP